MDCIFCKIINGDIPSAKVFENEKVLAFKDINPNAPVHILVIPKKHFSSMNEVSGENTIHAAKCLEAIALIAKQEKLDKGYRVISNCGEDGGQTVMHLHFHILAGEKLSEKMV